MLKNNYQSKLLEHQLAFISWLGNRFDALSKTNAMQVYPGRSVVFAARPHDKCCCANLGSEHLRNGSQTNHCLGNVSFR